jgi:hypothetical protein
MRSFRPTRLRLVAAILVGSLSFAGGAYAASLGLSSMPLYAGSQPLTRGSCSPAESDAVIRASNPNTNLGNQSAETVLSKSNGDSYVLIGFDPAASPCSVPTTGGADSASLTLTVTGTFKGPDTISAYPITSAWNASTVTWSTMPTFGSTPDFTFSGAGTYTFTVTATVDAGIKNGAFHGWMLVDTTGTNNATTVIAGHASAQAPSIALDYEK